MISNYSFHSRHIHRVIKKHAPKSVSRAKRIFSFKYPRLLLFLVSILIAYYLFRQPEVMDFFLELEKFHYLGQFVAGALLPFGFSAPFSIGFFIVSHPQNIILAAILASFGAMLGDMLIFKIIKVSFMKEFRELNKKKIVRVIENAVENNNNILIKHYLLYIFAGIMIATPLPDELGVSMLAGLTTIKPLKLAVISFLIHAVAISLILFFSVA